MQRTRPAATLASGALCAAMAVLLGSSAQAGDLDDPLDPERRRPRPTIPDGTLWKSATI